MNSPKYSGNSSYPTAPEIKPRRQQDNARRPPDAPDIDAPEMAPRRRPAEPPPLPDAPDLIAPALPPRRATAAPPGHTDALQCVAPQVMPRERSVKAFSPLPGLPAAPDLSRVRRAHPAIATIPRPLVSRAWNQRESLFFSFDALLDNVFDVRAIADYGVLGTLRLLRRGAARENHARYALQALLKNADALLPSAAHSGSSKGDLQAVLDGCGAFAAEVAACTCIADLLELQPAKPSAASDLRRWVEHLLALEARDASGRWAAAQMLLGFKEAVALRLQALERTEQALAKDRFAENKQLTGLTRGLAELSAAVAKQRHVLRFDALSADIRRAAPLTPARAANEALPWPEPVAGVEPDAALLGRINQKVRSCSGVTKAEVRDFVQQVFALPQTPDKAASMIALGRMYAQADTQRALQASLPCFDQALIILKACRDNVDTPEHSNVLRSCYEERAKSCMRLAKRLVKVRGSAQTERDARAHRDAAARDFAAAYKLKGCTEPDDKANYVAGTDSVRNSSIGERSASETYAALSEVCRTDENFSDGHYQRFWRAVEAFELDTHHASDKASPQKIAATEEAIAAFSAAELAALYQHRCVERKALTRRDAVHGTAGFATAVEQVVALHATAATLYTRAGDAPSRAAALLHLCHAVQHTGWLTRRCRSQLAPVDGPAPDAPTKALLRKHLSRLQRRQFTLLRQKSVVYGRLQLWSCQAKELEAALHMARGHGWQTKLPRLHLALFEAYLRQGKVEAAKTQLSYAAASPDAACNRGSRLPRAYLDLGRAYLEQGNEEAAQTHLRRAAESPDAGAHVQRMGREALQTIASGNVPKPGAASSADDPQALLAFQDQHILAECMQVLDDNERACGSTEGLVWQGFVEALLAAPDIKAWCEVVLGQVRVNAEDAVSPAQVLRLVNLANMEATFASPRMLQEMKACVSDAVAHFKSGKLRAQDAWIVENGKAQTALRQNEAFDAGCRRLTDLLAEGERIRPGSAGRSDIEALAEALSSTDADRIPRVRDHLKRLVPDLDEAALQFLTTHPADACDVLNRLTEAVLSPAVTLLVEHAVPRAGVPGGIGVLTVTGTTVFLSECLSRITATCDASANSDIREVRVVAEHLYIDTDITLRGTNLVLGADRVEWMTKRTGDHTFGPITVDLSGRDDTTEPPTRQKAASGVTPQAFGADGTNGSTGARGHDGAGGEAGGDLLIHCTQTCVGLAKAQVDGIYLRGGAGADGGNGGDGGDAGAGMNGANADQCNSYLIPMGFINQAYNIKFDGRPGGSAGAAGMGGAQGLGGEGGASGTLVLKGPGTATPLSEEARTAMVVTGQGPRGQDGQPGSGGQGAAGGEDGYDRIFTRDGLFGDDKTRTGHGLHAKGDANHMENWHEAEGGGAGTANRRRSEAAGAGAYRAQAEAPRRHRNKVQVDSAGFAKHVEGHLAQASQENRRDALADLTDTLAVARETAEALEAGGAELKAVLEEVNALRATTAAMVAQHEQRANAEVHRMARGPAPAPRATPRRVRIGYDDAPPPHVADALLQLADSPVPHPSDEPLIVHDVEVAIDAVNATRGDDPLAVAALMHALGTYLSEASDLPKAGQAQKLLARLAEVVSTSPLAPWVSDFHAMHAGLATLEQGAGKWPEVSGRVMARLHDAVEAKADLVREADARFQDTRRTTEAIIAATRREHRVRGALHHALATDHLLRSILATDAALDGRGKKRAWLIDRLQQKLTRMPATQAADAALVTTLVDALLDVAQDQPLHGAEAIATFVASHTQRLGAALELEKAVLVDQERHLEHGLLRACAYLVAHNAPAPASFETGDLRAIVHDLHVFGTAAAEAEAAVQRAAVAATEHQREAERASLDVEDLARALCAELPEQRLRLHLQRQLEMLRPAISKHPALAERVKLAFVEVYTSTHTGSDSTLLPLAGEMAAAMVVLTDERVRALHAHLVGAPAPDTDPGLALLRALMRGAGPADMHGRLASLSDDATDAFQDAAADFLQGRRLFATAQVMADWQVAAAAKAPAIVTDTVAAREMPEPQEALKASLLQVQRWFNYAALVPDVDFETQVAKKLSIPMPVADAAPTAGAQPVDVIQRLLAQAVLPAEARGMTDTTALVAYLEKALADSTGYALPDGAKGALFLLLTRDVSHAVTRRLVDLLHARVALAANRARPDADADPALSLLTFVHSTCINRLSDAALDLRQQWSEALAATRYKLALVRQQAPMSRTVSVTHIEKLLAFVDQGHRHAPAEVQSKILEQAVEATGTGITHLQAALQGVKHSILQHVGNLDTADGWDAALAESYNNALGSPAQALPSEAAEAFVALVEKLPKVLPAGADLARLGTALMVGAQELALTRDQQERLFTQLHQRQNTLPVAESCLSLLQAKWFGEIRNIEQANEKSQALLHDKILKQQQTFLSRITKLMEAANVLHSETYLARTQLFVALLERYFVTSRTDKESGAQRLAIYEEAAQQAEALVAGQEAEAAFENFVSWLDAKLCKRIAPEAFAADQKAYFAHLLTRLTSSNHKNLDMHAVDEVIAGLDALAWRSVLDYHTEADNCAVALLKARLSVVAPKLDTSDAAYIRLARCLKIKVADPLVHSDTSSAREAAQAMVAQDAAAVAQAFEDTLAWLSAAIPHPDQLPEIAKFGAQLQAICSDPRLPVPSPVTATRATESVREGHQEKTTPAPEAFDAWMGRVLAAKSELTVAIWESDVIPACAEHIAYLSKAASPASDALDLDDEDLSLRLAAMHALLAEPRPTGPLSQTSARELAKVRKQIATLQDMVIRREAAAAAKRDRAVAAMVARAPTPNPCETAALESALEAAAAYFGDAAFVVISGAIEELLNKKDVTLAPASLAEVWLALPDSPNLMGFEDTLERTLPENWAVALRVAQCTAAMGDALAMAGSVHADTALPPERNESPDAYCDRMIALRGDVFTQGMADWQAWLTDMQQTSGLDADALAHVLGLMARKLTYFAATATPFPHDAFQAFADDMRGADVLRLLQRELKKPDSLIVAGFRDASFELNRYVICQAWVVATLESAMDGLAPAEKGRLVALLMELASTRQKTRMQTVVRALAAGGVLTTDAVDAIAGFVDRSFELDDEALRILRGRAGNAAWLTDLSDHTNEQRSHLRTAPDLARLMAAESEGVNASVAAWVTSDGPDETSKLQKALAAVQAVLDDPALGGGTPIAKWDHSRISAWAENKTEGPDGKWHRTHRGAQLWESPERLHEAMAVLCRSIKLVHGFWLRDTQLATIYLTVRDGIAPDARGKLAQVATGEGKSLITAGIAILKALGGQSVDVITTSKVLAERDAAGNASLYGMFHLSVSNNCDDACEFGEAGMSPEMVRRARYCRDDRPVDIVYGEAGAFERDQLLTEFNPQDPDKQVITGSRRDKASRCALVDEVDGLLLDNASMVLYLSHEMESLRPLEHLFVRIWDLVNSVPLPPGSYENGEVLAALGEAMRKKIKAGEIPLPGYNVRNAPYVEIQNMIDRRLNDWIRSALYARTLRLKHEYIVVGGKKPAVVVVDKGTGVEQTSLKWSHGLHQFLQLKHGLEVSPESLKAVFLSNLFFFKQYGNQLFGLSGTLGSEVEQTCLTKLFGVELFKMPRAYGEKYVQKAPVVQTDAEGWSDAILAEVTAQRDKGRATLVVCDTIEDVLSLERHLKEAFPALHTYISAQQQLEFLDPAQPRLVGPGDVIIATNLAGRGTDFKTSSDLEQAGGLHVILSYLPSNVRIQEQAFGRTARSGNKGTGQFIICDPSRQPVHALCRARDMAEKQRLERVLERDVCRIAFEHDLLMGFEHNNETFGGFAALLKDVTDTVLEAGQPAYYATAQIDSLKNRWAAWLDCVSAKLDLVHVIGRDTVVASYKSFASSVKADLKKGWEALIVEPAEWMKLGAAYRRDKRWHEAQQCYDCAARDPEYAVARYYKAACQLIQTPSNEAGAKKAFSAEAKATARAIESKLHIFQESAQSVARLASQARLRGDQDFGTPYQARATEKLQLWQIFLSSISEALGDAISLDGLNTSPHIKDKAHAQTVVDALVEAELAKPTRRSQKFRMEGERFYQGKQEIVGLDAYSPVAAQLRDLLSPAQPSTGGASGRAVTQAALTKAMQGLMTRDRARAVLADKATITSRSRTAPIDDFWEGWDDKAYLETRRALAKRYAQARENAQPGETPESFEQRFLNPESAADELDPKHCEKFFAYLKKQHVVAEDHELNFEALVQEHDDYAKLEDAVDAVKRKFEIFDASLVQALTLALVERYRPEATAGDDLLNIAPAERFRLKRTLLSSELALPESVEMAAKDLWGTLEAKGAIKPPKLTFPSGRTVEVQMEHIKHVLRMNGALQGDDIMVAADAVATILESTLGMLRTLDDKKVTVEFAEIARAYFLDQAQSVPPALREFVEAGLDVVASLIEKKDPPTWYDTTALVVMGMAQIVGGVLIKEFVPVAGELIGNTLINTGIDDIVFGISSAIKGEFAWSDYWSAKQNSMLSALMSAAFVSVASFTGSVVKDGVGKAWTFQQSSHIERLKDVAPVFGTASFNVVPHIAKEVGRTLVNAGISQIANRGVQGVVGIFADASADALKDNVRRAVAHKWSAVVAQAHALRKKLNGDPNVSAVIGNCIREVLQAAAREQSFASLARTSKPAISIAASGVPHGGWSKVIEASGDVANLGVSMHRMHNLVETEVEALARAIGSAAANKTAEEFTREPMGPAELDAMLGKKQTEFSDALINVINGLLRTSVFSPLVSYGAQYAIEDIVASLFPKSEIEEAAASADFVDKVKKRKSRIEEAHTDDLFRDARNAHVQIDLEALPPDLRAEFLERAVEATGKTVGELEAAYQGCELKFYIDEKHNVYVQRPDSKGYGVGVKAKKPVGEPEIMAEALLQGRPITLTDRADGTVKTYHPDGRIDDTTPTNAISLLCTAGENGRLHHITAASPATTVPQDASNTDCFYVAVIQETGSSMSVQEARNRIADKIQGDPACQRFYHNWSLDGRVKEFAGEYAGSGIYARAMGSDVQEMAFWAENAEALKFAAQEIYRDAVEHPWDFITDQIPWVSGAKDAHSVVIGENIITGEVYSGEQRAEIGGFAVLGTVIPKGAAKGTKYYKKYMKLLGRGKKYASTYGIIKDHPELLAKMRRPRFKSLQDERLAKYLDKEFWRAGSKIGNGSTAAAVRYEAETGLKVGGRWHREKAEGGVKHLEDWLRLNSTAPKRDRELVEALLQDTRNALNGL